MKAHPMPSYEYDLIVVGGGSGGVAAARRAAEYGARVAVCEDNQWGGTCVHRGCVPKKLLLYAAQFGAQRKMMSAYGWDTSSLALDWQTLKDNLHKELERLHGFYRRVLEDSKVDKLSGTGVLRDAHSIEVSGKVYTAQRFLLAVGGVPERPAGLEGGELGLTSDDIFWLPKLPQDILVVGSGYIGTEFAGILNGLGVRVQHSFGREQVLPSFDIDLRLTVQAGMEKRGIVFHPQRRPLRLTRLDSGRIKVDFDAGATIEVAEVLLATGRRPRTEGIGLEEIGVSLGHGGKVLTDELFCTSVPNIFAIGDCTKRHELTPVAIAEGRQLAEHLFNGKELKFRYDSLPTAIFSSPPAGSVGFSEDFLRGKNAGFDVYRAKFRPMKYSLPGAQEEALVKLLVDPKSDRLLGCHLVGESSPELIQLVASLLRARASMDTLRSTIAVHPTFAEEIVLFRKPSVSVEGSSMAPMPDEWQPYATLAES